MTQRFRKLSHSLYECKYPIIFCPKYAVSNIMGFLKGKLAIRVFNRYEQLRKRYYNKQLWSRGYCVSTVGIDEEKVRKYVQWQEQQEKHDEAHLLGAKLKPPPEVVAVYYYLKAMRHTTTQQQKNVRKLVIRKLNARETRG